MAIFHFSAQQISRGAGRSAVAAAAYRACEKLTDARTGLVHDFRRKRGRDLAAVVLPGGGTMGRNELWDAVERKHKRGDAIIAREVEIGLPHELTKSERDELIKEYCQELADTYKVAVDFAVHIPTHAAHEKHAPNHFEHDPRNFHAHISMSACYVSADGEMGKKCVEMDPIHCKRAKIENAVETQRKRWQEICNRALEKAGHAARIDHRSHASRGIPTPPGQHYGPAVSGLLARGESSEVADRQASEDRLIDIADIDALTAASKLDVEAAEQELAEAQAEAQAEHDAGEQAKAQAQAQTAATAAATAAAAAAAKQATQEQAAARNGHATAQTELEAATKAANKAEAQAEALRHEHDKATQGQRQAGQSVIKTALALPKAAAWARAIDAYERAEAAYRAAVKRVKHAIQVVAQKWAEVVRLDPAERQRQQAAQQEHTETKAAEDRQREVALAQRQAERFTPAGTRPDRPKKQQMYEHSRQADQDKDQDRERDK
jgi:hypothetical protein